MGVRTGSRTKRRRTGRERGTVLLLLAVFLFALFFPVPARAEGTTNTHTAPEGAAFDTGDDSLIDLSDGWTDGDGNPVDITRLAKVMAERGVTEMDIYNTMPPAIKNGASLMFRSSNLYFSVQIAGWYVYYYDYRPAWIAGNGYGTDYHVIPVQNVQSRKEIHLHVRRCYRSSGDFYDIRIGDTGTYLEQTFRSMMPAFLTSAFLIIVGGLLTIFSFIIDFSMKSLQRSFRAMSVTTLLFGIWSILQTGIPVLLVGHAQVLRIFQYPVLILMSYTMVLTIDGWMDHPFPWTLKAANTLLLIEIAGCTFCKIVFQMDLHQCNFTIFGCILIAGLFCTILSIRQVVTEKNRRSRVNAALILAILTLCFVAALLDMITYLEKGRAVPDQAAHIRYAFCIMMIAIDARYVHEIRYRLGESVKAKAFEEMAYRDVLTGIGNRFASQKKLEELEQAMKEKTVSFVRLVSIDVNFLKKVNDLRGHQAGDEYLKHAAAVLSETAGDRGCCYRTGGDEFVVLLPDCTKEEYAQMLEKLNRLEAEKKVSMACGSAIWRLDGKKEEEDTYAELVPAQQCADKRMYENKVRMKAVRTD